MKMLQNIVMILLLNVQMILKKVNMILKNCKKVYKSQKINMKYKQINQIALLSSSVKQKKNWGNITQEMLIKNSKEKNEKIETRRQKINPMEMSNFGKKQVKEKNIS